MSIHELQAALRALDEAADGHTANAAEVYATARVIEAARRVAEGAGEPVAWLFWHRSDPDASLASVTRVKENADHLSQHGYIVQPLYTTPPSADALVEALERLSAEWRGAVEKTNPSPDVARTVEYLASELDALIAKHKENTR